MSSWHQNVICIYQWRLFAFNMFYFVSVLMQVQLWRQLALTSTSTTPATSCGYLWPFSAALVPLTWNTSHTMSKTAQCLSLHGHKASTNSICSVTLTKVTSQTMFPALNGSFYSIKLDDSSSSSPVDSMMCLLWNTTLLLNVDRCSTYLTWWCRVS